ncbi:M23 family metallopeptidase [Deinococcus aerolatus]|nr:M23 family metallopeptidase [Deinococcus aerolatus]
MTLLLAGCMQASPAPANAPPTVTITPSGGSVELQGVAIVTFVDGSFASAQPVELMQTEDAEAQQAFDVSVAGEDVTLLSDYQVRVVTPERPLKDMRVTMKLPSSFNVPQGSTPMLFGWTQESENEGEGGMLDLFRPLPSSYEAASRSITGDVPSWVFASQRRTDGRAEAVLSVALAPALQPVSAQTIKETCKTEELFSPFLGEALSISSPFGPRPLKSSPFHNGVDIVAPIGKPVVAITSGEVVAIGFQEKISPKGQYGGAGEFIVVKTGAGHYVVYMHLMKGSTRVKARMGKTPGDRLLVNQWIANSGNTGAAKDAPHLHIEYRNSRFAGTVDPLPCLEPLDIEVTGNEGIVATNKDVQLKATINALSDTNGYRRRVVWSVVGGAGHGVIDRLTGLYHSPLAAGTYTIRAMLQLDVKRPGVEWVDQSKIYRDVTLTVKDSLCNFNLLSSARDYYNVEKCSLIGSFSSVRYEHTSDFNLQPVTYVRYTNVANVLVDLIKYGPERNIGGLFRSLNVINIQDTKNGKVTASCPTGYHANWTGGGSLVVVDGNVMSLAIGAYDPKDSTCGFHASAVRSEAQLEQVPGNLIKSNITHDSDSLSFDYKHTIYEYKSSIVRSEVTISGTFKLIPKP